MAKSDVLVRMRADVSNYDANIAKARKQLESFKQDNLTLGGILNQSSKSIVAAAAQYASFGAALGAVASGFQTVISEGTRMAREMEGVKMAFDRLNQPGLLDSLREATHGTVNDLELMKNAVKFENFGLSLEQMGTFLAFAQQQAKDTGQSVEYLVDSIVTGLGRKSLPILDNLGLSATEIRKRMGETGDMTKAVADIIKERMEAAGGYIETAGDRAAKATADMENAMMRLGETFGPIIQNSDSLWNSIKVGAINALNAVGRLINFLHEDGRINNTIANMNGGGMMERFGNRLRNSKDPSSLYQRQLAEINRSINSAEAKLQQAEKGGMGSIQIYRERVEALKEIRRQYQELYKTIANPPQTTPFQPASSFTVKNSGKSGGKGFDISSIAFNQNKAMLAAVKWQGEEGPSAVWEAITQGAVKSTNAVEDLTKAFEELNKAEGITTTKEIASDAKSTQSSFSDAAGAISAVGQALNSINDPTAKIMGIVAQAIATIAQGFATATSASAGGGVFAWIASLAAGGAAMMSAIGAIHSATGYAQGGVIPGNSYSGDNQWARVNAGETILTRAQAGLLADALANEQPKDMQPYVKGDMIFLGANNYTRASGQGEIVTTSMLRRMGLM